MTRDVPGTECRRIPEVLPGKKTKRRRTNSAQAPRRRRGPKPCACTHLVPLLEAKAREPGMTSDVLLCYAVGNIPSPLDWMPDQAPLHAFFRPMADSMRQSPFLQHFPSEDVITGEEEPTPEAGSEYFA